MNTDFHHVYSKGEMVIFRDADDYYHFQNRLAIEKYGKNLKILAYSIMSTHVHLIVETWDEDALREFIAGIKRAYAVHFKHKYGISLPPKFLQIEYSDDENTFESKKNRLVYVLKNPVHHQICGSALSYEFSSARFTFMDELFGENLCKTYRRGLRKVSELKAREARQILARNIIETEKILVEPETGAISPLSIIDISKARAYWGKYLRNYILDLHLRAKDSAGEYISEDALCVQSEKISDTEVCKIIDEFARENGAKSFVDIKDDKQNLLVGMLRSMLVPKSQIERCLWTNI